jgi:hypothetical protein
MAGLNKYFLLLCFTVARTIIITAQVNEKNTYELKELSSINIIGLNSFLKSKEFKVIFKKLYHCKPKINYIDYNLNYTENCLNKLDSVSLSALNLKLMPNANVLIADTIKYWTNSQLLFLRKWSRNSNYYVVFTKPEKNILSFYIVRDRGDIKSQIQYMSEIHNSNNSLFFSILLTDKNYKLLCWSGGIKG